MEADLEDESDLMGHTPGSEEAWVLTTQAAEETKRLGALLAPFLRPGDIIALRGDLGAGKTTFVQGVARGLGITRPVTSPSFILINEYPSTPPLFHIDCYRLEDADAEARDIGLEDLLYDDGVCVIEWADRVATLLPPERIDITLMWLGPDEREIEVRGHGTRYTALVRKLRQEWQAIHEARDS
jgi:tRNA threonylcarbamoyladenosine biosynthesis protein TsaE